MNSTHVTAFGVGWAAGVVFMWVGLGFLASFGAAADYWAADDVAVVEQEVPPREGKGLSQDVVYHACVGTYLDVFHPVAPCVEAVIPEGEPGNLVIPVPGVGAGGQLYVYLTWDTGGCWETGGCSELRPLPPGGIIFRSGFETGNHDEWSKRVPGYIFRSGFETGNHDDWSKP